MKQKFVIKLSVNSQKSHSKALRIAVGVLGVESAALGKKDKSQIEVVGDGVDAVKLTSLLRKRLARGAWMPCLFPNNGVYAELVSVSAVKEKEDEKDKEEAKVQPIAWSYGYSMPQYIIY
ncbi:hypothetical protein P3X46_028915 [Hevea brasiliensis]|uniref:HMA domain-containing protein n=1 Tax=Hevea brasiliensis TaxID=3981 RepID=A0ABQ9KQM7_HEVBR|nr:uncharacterized protein LOC110645103 [Hevea brasiliensis]KAJ9146680.1 hypothetical protein P3X46_028915 [Hevea brasiliensis]